MKNRYKGLNTSYGDLQLSMKFCLLHISSVWTSKPLWNNNKKVKLFCFMPNKNEKKLCKPENNYKAFSCIYLQSLRSSVLKYYEKLLIVKKGPIDQQRRFLLSFPFTIYVLQGIPRKMTYLKAKWLNDFWIFLLIILEAYFHIANKLLYYVWLHAFVSKISTHGSLMLLIYAKQPIKV